MKIAIKFAWYALWIGAYIDRKRRVIYICPLPMVLIIIKLYNPKIHMDLETDGDTAYAYADSEKLTDQLHQAISKLLGENPKIKVISLGKPRGIHVESEVNYLTSWINTYKLARDHAYNQLKHPINTREKKNLTKFIQDMDTNINRNFNQISNLIKKENEP